MNKDLQVKLAFGILGVAAAVLVCGLFGFVYTLYHHFGWKIVTAVGGVLVSIIAVDWALTTTVRHG